MNWATCSAEYPYSFRFTSAVTRSWTSNPSLTLWALYKLRRHSTPAIRSTRQVANCPTMSAATNRERRGLPAAVSSFNADAGLTRVPCQAGTRPKRIPVSNETSAVYASTRTSALTSGRIGSDGGVSRSSSGSDALVSSRPRPPLSSASSTLSLSSCLTRRQREAPIDERTAISRCRATARASIRLAALAHAISRTREPRPSERR